MRLKMPSKESFLIFLKFMLFMLIIVVFVNLLYYATHSHLDRKCMELGETIGIRAEYHRITGCYLEYNGQMVPESVWLPLDKWE